MMLLQRLYPTQLLFVITCYTFYLWVWMLQPKHSYMVKIHEDIKFQSSNKLIFQVQALQKSQESLIRNFTQNATLQTTSGPILDVRNSLRKSSSENQNQTLEYLKQNMTMLKANMSGIGQLIEGLNQTVNHSHLDLINPHPFKYLINTKSVCKEKLFVLAYIHTAPDHYKRRMVIRQTWGNPKYYTDLKMRIVFVMGKTDRQDIQDALEFEAEQYHDIVQEDFLDSYRNLTYKGIAALKWISNYCPDAKFILKADDDIFVNTFTLFRRLQSLNETGIDNKGLLMCLVWSRMKVMREGKWKVDIEDFKDDFYPTYCSGSAYTMSTDVAIAMHNISYHIPFFWVDDFYITGMLPMKLGNIKYKQFMSTYILDRRKLEDKFTGPQWFTYIFSHVHDLNAIQSVWDSLVKLAQGETKHTVKYALPGQLPNEAEIFRKQKELDRKKALERKKKKEQEEASKRKMKQRS